MPARLALVAACLLWLSYESHFSPGFFLATVETSLAEILGGIDEAIVADSNAIAAKSDAIVEKSDWIAVETPIIESPVYVQTAAK